MSDVVDNTEKYYKYVLVVVIIISILALFILIVASLNVHRYRIKMASMSEKDKEGSEKAKPSHSYKEEEEMADDDKPKATMGDKGEPEVSRVESDLTQGDTFNMSRNGWLAVYGFTLAASILTFLFSVALAVAVPVGWPYLKKELEKVPS